MGPSFFPSGSGSGTGGDEELQVERFLRERGLQPGPQAFEAWLEEVRARMRQRAGVSAAEAADAFCRVVLGGKAPSHGRGGSAAGSADHPTDRQAEAVVREYVRRASAFWPEQRRFTCKPFCRMYA